MCDSDRARHMHGRARAILLVLATFATALLFGCMPYELRTILDGPQGKALSISPSTTVVPANGTVGFTAAGGVGPYVYSLVSGSGGIDPVTGVYTPVSAGSAVVRVTDKTGRSVDATITIQPVGTGLAISPASITISIGASITFVPIGGSTPYSFSIQTTPPPGSVNPGINPSTGAYTAGSTPGDDVVILTDGAAATVTATVHVVPFSTVDYTITGTSFSGTGTVSTALPGGQTFALKNIGSSPGTQPVDWKVYLSANATLDAGDTVVASGTTSALAAGASNLAVPVTGGSFPAVAPGPYYLIVQLTSNDDTTPGNNTSAASPIILNPQNIDYVTNPVSNTGGTTAGAGMTGAFTIKNQGTAAGSSTVVWQVRASADTTLDASDYIVAGGTLSALGAGTTSSTINFSGTWPSTPGPWYLIAVAVAADDINHLNDVSTATLVTTTGVAPANVDYTVSPVTSTGGTTAGKPLTGSFTYTNNGTNAGAQPVYWTAYVSSDATLQLGTDTVIDSGTAGPLGATPSSSSVPFTGTWPAAPGTWHLIVSVSSPDDIVPTNNITASGALAITAPNVDYTVQSVNNTAGTVAGDPLSGTFTYRNGGTQDGSQTVVWTAYVSSDATLQIGTDTVIDSGVVPALAAATTSGAITFNGAWPSAAGSWYLIIAVTVSEDVAPGNNTGVSGAIATSAPNVDYTVLSVNNTGGTTAGSALSGNLTLRNIGTHAGTQFVPWRAYLSTDATLQIGVDTLITSGFLPSPGLGAGVSSSAIPIAGTWPSSSTVKTYYLIIEVGAGDDVASGNNDGVSALVTVNPPDINYSVPAVNNTGGTSTGGPLTGNFTIHNNGVNNGVSTINWTAHLSSDATLQVTDPVIATGSAGPLAGSGTSAVIPFAGTWPVTAGTWYLIVEANASDDTNPADNWTASIPISVTTLTPNYSVTAVPLPAGTKTEQAVNGNFTVQNIGTAAGVTTVNWEVYASLGNNTYDAGDTLLAAGSFAPLGISASTSPVYAGTWPATAGTYYIIVRVFTADDASIADVSSGPIAVTTPPKPDYTAVFNAAIPWSGLVGTAMSLTGTPQMTIQNLSVNPGIQSINWAVYLSTDNVLDAGDTLVQQGSIAPLAGSGTFPIPFGTNWPAAPGQLYFLIAVVNASDDANPTNDVVIAPHPCAIGDYRYVEGAENNNGKGPNPPVAQTSNTGVTSLGANQTIAIEGTMDAYVGANSQYDTYLFTTNATMSRLSIRAMWATGFDDIDLYLWDTGTTNLSSVSIGINSEPGANDFNVTAVTPRDCYISANSWLAGNTSGSAGKPYVILVRGLP